jgi:hypothetical protein
MKLAGWKRTVLAGLLAVTVAGASVATFSAGHASANPGEGCVPQPHGLQICWDD